MAKRRLAALAIVVLGLVGTMVSAPLALGSDVGLDQQGWRVPDFIPQVAVQRSLAIDPCPEGQEGLCVFNPHNKG